MELFIIAIAVVLVLLLLWTIFNYQNSRRHLNGSWVACDEFLLSSGLDDMRMVLDLSNGLGYMIIIQNDAVFNTGLTINHNLLISTVMNPFNPTLIEFDLELPEMESEWKSPASGCYRARLDTVNNLLEVFQDDTIYGLFQREPDADTDVEVDGDGEKIK